jgi:hypothetical protein
MRHLSTLNLISQIPSKNTLCKQLEEKMSSTGNSCNKKNLKKLIMCSKNASCRELKKPHTGNTHQQKYLVFKQQIKSLFFFKICVSMKNKIKIYLRVMCLLFVEQIPQINLAYSLIAKSLLQF